MTRDELITEISVRRGVSVEDVETVLEEEDIVIEEEKKACKKRRCIIFTIVMIIFLAGTAFSVYVLDKKEKIDVENAVKKYLEKINRNDKK